MSALKYSILLVMFFTSCITKERCRERFPPTEETVIVYRDTIIVHYIEGETQFDTIHISEPIEPINSRLKTEYCFSHVWTENDQLFHDLEQREVEIETVIEKVEVETVKEIHHPPIVVTEQYLTRWQRVRVWAGNILIVFVISVIVWAIVKRKIPIFG